MEKKYLTTVVLATAILGLAAGNAFALHYTPDGTSLQQTLDNITVGGTSSVDVTTDYLADYKDSYWDITATGGSIATLIIELADFAPNNVFGVYNSGVYVPIFDGGASDGAQKSLSILADGTVWVNFVDSGYDFEGDLNFGYYLDSSYYPEGGLFHSDSSLNADKLDHMLAYQGNNIDTLEIFPFAAGTWTDNEFILAFEDKLKRVDWDYNDFVVMVESVQPVEPIPEPATMLLFGTGLAGLVGAARRRKAQK